MKMYVWTGDGVLQDWDSGMIAVHAGSIAEARKIATETVQPDGVVRGADARTLARREAGEPDDRAQERQAAGLPRQRVHVQVRGRMRWRTSP